MRILNYVLYISILSALFCATATATANPPYYFSAEISEYPSAVNGTLMREFVNFDSLSPDVSYINDRLITPADVVAVMDNRALEKISKKITVQFAYTLYTVNMSMLPSKDTYHKGKPDFDSNQYTRLGASAPVAILHTSRDGKFYFVQADCMRGWLPAESVKIYEAHEFKRISTMPYIRVAKDGTEIGGIIYNIGDKVPCISERKQSYAVLLPNAERAVVKKGPELTVGDRMYSSEAIKPLAESLIGDPYDWGGKKGFRDCSSFVRDLWLVFGIDLPRNTFLQAQTGKVLIENPKKKEDFYSVLENAVPFKTLIFFKGHVIMFGGFENGDYTVYHAVNRLAHDNGTVEELAAVVKQNLQADGFSDIWKRVTRVIQIN